MEAGTAQVANITHKGPKLQPTAWAGVIVVSALVFRLIRLGNKSFWLDETYRVYLAGMNWHDFLRAVVRPFGANSVAFHLILRYWLMLGRSEATIRGLSVVFGVGIVLALYNLGAELFDKPTGLIAAALAATNPFLIQYSQEVCAYTLAGLLAVLASRHLLRALKDDSPKNWLAYTLTATVMVYCHVLSFMVVAAHAVAVLLARKGRIGPRAVASLATVGSAFALLACCIAFVPPHARVWLSRPGIHELELLLGDLGGPRGMLLGLFLLLFAVLTFKHACRGPMAVGTPNWHFALLLLWSLLPPILLFVISQWKPLFLNRYLLPSLPALLLLVAASVMRLNHVRLRVLCAGAMLLLSIGGSLSYLQQRSDSAHTDDWRDATAYLAQQVRSGDVVVFYYHHERLPFQYYRERFSPQGFAAQVIPTGSNEALLEDPDPIESDASAVTAAKSYRRVWLVYSGALAATKYGSLSDLRRFYRKLAHSFQTSSEVDFGNIRVTLFAGAHRDAD